ncbi:MAG: Flp pilus assembly protein CpaB [Pirellulales bacterium]
MRPKSLVLLALASGCGLIASIGISQVIDSNKRGAPEETVPIYVALQNINLGDPIDDGMLSLQEWPKGKIPLGAITKWEDIEERRPRTTIFQGEPLLDGKLLPKGHSQDPISAIPRNHRLKTISVDARKSAAGLLSPGDRVDIQLFVQQNERQGIMFAFTKIILQNIRVFAVDQAVQRSVEGGEARNIAKTVSVILTPEQANRVTLAENLGEISLIPRHPDDDEIVDDVQVTSDDLLQSGKPGSREAEQGFAVVQNGIGSLLGLQPGPQLTAQVPAENESEEQEDPFRLRIIFPDKVQEVRFNPSGNPIYDSPGDTAAIPEIPTYHASPANEEVDSSGENVKIDDAFPINFRRK